MKSLFLFTLMFIAGVPGKAQSIQQVIERHFNALNKHDANLLAADYDGAVQFYSVSWDGMKTGIAEVKTAYDRYWHTSPDLTYKITKVVYGGQSATIEYETTGTMTNLEAGSPAYMQGKKYTLKNCTVIQIIGGKIVYDSTYFDQVAFLRQMDFFNQK